MRLVRLIAIYYSNATKPPSKIFFGSVSGRPVGMSTRGLKLNPSVDGPARPGSPFTFLLRCSAPSLYRSKYSSRDLDRIFVIPHKSEKFIFVWKGPTLSHLTDSVSTVDQHNLVIGLSKLSLLTPLFTPLICPLSCFSCKILINGRNNEKINGPLMVNFETPFLQKCNNDENNGLPLSWGLVSMVLAPPSCLSLRSTIPMDLGLAFACT